MKGKVLYKNYNHFLSGGKHVNFFCKVEYFNMKQYGDLTLLLGKPQVVVQGTTTFTPSLAFFFISGSLDG